MTISRREFLRVSSSAVAVLLAGRVDAEAMYWRKEVRTLSTGAIDSLRAGVAAMKALPYTNPFSWIYQAAVHGKRPATAADPDAPDAPQFWRKCPHHHAQFFPWHRWELLYWEEIMRQLSGSMNFALPYWDYIQNGFLPDAFRAPAAGATNSLYDGTRSAALNNGTAALGGISIDGMAETDFLSFQTLFEQNPHDAVHGAIGGNMGSVPTAARDPIFWLHHANIDRHWVLWLRQGGGRANPTGSWASTSFSFQTVSGVKNVTSGGAGATDPLGYTYDAPMKPFPPLDIGKLLDLYRPRFKYVVPKIVVLPQPPKPPGPGPDPAPWRAFTAATGGFTLDGHGMVVPFPKDAKAANLLSKTLAAPSQQLALTLYNVRATDAGNRGGFHFQVLLVPSQKALSAGKTSGAVSVGSFSSFTLSVEESHVSAGHAPTANITLRLGAAARAMLAKSVDRDPGVVFVRRGLVDKSGKELDFNRDERLFQFDELRLELR